MISNSTNFPLNSGSPADLACVRGFLREAQFDDPTLCSALEMENMSALGRVDWSKFETKVVPATLAWCIRVFARGLFVEQAATEEICGQAVLAAMFKTGLLRPMPNASARWFCPVWLYPLKGFIIASDRCQDPEGQPCTPPTDVVFPAIYGGTLRFLDLLPGVHGGDALDLCGGSGIGALVLSKTARSSVTTDLAERSALFAEFNGRLNDFPVESFAGDLYEPVLGRQFDVITAHPPFVPATGPNMVYRDGGDSGEEVTRGVVAGLPVYLRPGGTCMILCVARDTGELPFERRAKEWLGASQEEFDVVFGMEKVLSVQEVVDSIHKRGQQISDAGAQQLLLRLQSLGTRQFVYGVLFIRRYARTVTQPPARIRITLDARAPEVERLLVWRQHSEQAGFAQWLAASKPRLAPQLQLVARHVVREGSLVPAEFIFEIEAGIQAALRLDGWVVPLVATLEGSRTVGEVFETSRATGELPAGFKLEDFCGLIRGMIDRGFLIVDGPVTSH